MVKDEVLQSRITEITRHIEELRKQGLDAPDKIAETLSKILDELEISLEELSAADEELCLQNEKLIDAEERFRTAIDFTYDWETWLDPDGNYIYVFRPASASPGIRLTSFKEIQNLLERSYTPMIVNSFPDISISAMKKPFLLIFGYLPVGERSAGSLMSASQFSA
jgi:PAS domain-containing protein